MLLFLDPGHGGEDPGAVANGYIEKNLNLQLSLKLAERLRKTCEVRLTRVTDINLSLKERADKAKAEKADLLLSIHFNACDGKARGVEVIHSIKAKADTVALAHAIAKGVFNLGIPFRRIFSKASEKYPGQDWYGIPRYSLPMPALIVESLFIDNAGDINFLKQPEFIDRLADGIAEAIKQYYGLSELNMAIMALQHEGIIGVPEYWSNNAKAGKTVKGEFAEKLIINMAEYIKKGGMQNG